MKSATITSINHTRSNQLSWARRSGAYFAVAHRSSTYDYKLNVFLSFAYNVGHIELRCVDCGRYAHMTLITQSTKKCAARKKRRRRRRTERATVRHTRDRPTRTFVRVYTRAIHRLHKLFVIFCVRSLAASSAMRKWLRPLSGCGRAKCGKVSHNIGFTLSASAWAFEQRAATKRSTFFARSSFYYNYFVGIFHRTLYGEATATAARRNTVAAVRFFTSAVRRMLAGWLVV